MARTERFSDATWRAALSHEGLVVTIASVYRGRGLELADLIQVGLVGACRGIERHDPARGPLKTSLSLWIRQAIRAAIAREGSLIRIPTHTQRIAARARKGQSLSSVHAALAHDARTAIGVRYEMKDVYVARPRDIDLVELAEVCEVIGGLPARERTILVERFENGKTLREVAALLNVSHEQVRLLERRAIARIREIFQVS